MLKTNKVSELIDVDELAAPVLNALRTKHADLWRRVKAHEADSSSSDDEALQEVTILIHALNDELGIVEIGRTLVKVRELAIEENRRLRR